jgi:hypothetical protein
LKTNSIIFESDQHVKIHSTFLQSILAALKNEINETLDGRVEIIFTHETQLFILLKGKLI